ncbi:glycosyltransferase [Paenibacillus sp. B01]|uniref:glycosyltransferase n=1 Tax=Paenibacillus sp. B01 TaxID=2660554 RepID=UPI00129BCECB|nr:glycosyltransferase [Paenibacillus sp. B01]QGG58081.1 glycosyltransferase [Paenibacillus sp. B01]
MLISVCLIVKDEEEVLGRCLDSVKEAADEIIVVDTGSSDGTKEVAAKYTDKIYDFEWIKDFSAARNESIRHAEGTWILVLDADEYFAPGEAMKLREFLGRSVPSENEIYTLNVSSFIGKSRSDSILTAGQIPRLFPNRMGFSYHRPIHEQLQSERDVQLVSIVAPVSLYHTGYLKETVAAKSKIDRNAELLAQMKQSKGFVAYDLFTVGNEFAVQDNLPKAVYYYEKAIRSKEDAGAMWYSKCVIVLVQCYIRLNRYVEALQLLEKNLGHWSSYPDFSYLKASLLHYLGFLDEAEQVYLKTLEIAMKKAQQDAIFWLESAEFASTLPMRKLAAIYENRGNLERAVYYWSKLLQQDPHDFNALHSLVHTIFLREEPDAIIRLLDKMYPEGNSNNLYILFRTSATVGADKLVEHYFSKLREAGHELAADDWFRAAFALNDRSLYTEARSRYPEHHLKGDLYLMQAVRFHRWEMSIPAYAPGNELESNEFDSIPSLLNGTADASSVKPEVVSILL